MLACPACTSSMRDADLHCQAEECSWLKCGKCACLFDDDGTYCGTRIWGNEAGYLKADG